MCNKKKLQFLMNEKKNVSGLLFSFPPLLISLPAIVSHSALRFFARCIFHHPNPFYVVSEVLMLSAAQQKRFQIFKCCFKMHVWVCVAAAAAKKKTKREEKSYQTFFIMHILVFGTDFCMLFEKCISGRECRGETSLDKPNSSYTPAPPEAIHIRAWVLIIEIPALCMQCNDFPFVY